MQSRKGNVEDKRQRQPKEQRRRHEEWNGGRERERESNTSVRQGDAILVPGVSSFDDVCGGLLRWCLGFG
jgi:hypothetical protein